MYLQMEKSGRELRLFVQLHANKCAPTNVSHPYYRVVV